MFGSVSRIMASDRVKAGVRSAARFAAVINQNGYPKKGRRI
ncbi:hypothetical protein D3OALGA1CA_1615 [Olavius algarvensis associated proteobacterium Delta 3]|nr:hypothetical protein D3OALGA1CA_1615 [Olavius algarvensis associated proteobacterium Delta 3]